MNFKQMINANRIRRLLQARSKLDEVLRKLALLELENENILNYLAKYNVLGKKKQSYSKITKSLAVHEDSNINHQPKVDFTVIEL